MDSRKHLAMLRVMPQNWEPHDWAEGLASRVAREITRLRGARSAQWLSDRTEELGYRISRSVITDLENGRRRHVSLHEIVILAAALSTAPLNLLYGQDDGQDIEYLPKEHVQRLVAVQRFSGIDNEILRQYEEKVALLSQAGNSIKSAAQELSEQLAVSIAIVTDLGVDSPGKPTQPDS